MKKCSFEMHQFELADPVSRWFSKILRNSWGWYVKILTIPYRGRWMVWKRPKTPLRNIKMVPKTVKSSKQLQSFRTYGSFL